ncbi:CRISPR-associated aCascade subunit Cas7/Csa2 2 [Metallosphaera sp. J1]|uniref:type I-A CRISPR-associated protein Cas7/Csa2 n=1 Tax=Metallosphaera javensis (ex Hofmann et al. 2022) TaxID=99938 RepID=UPI001EDF6660|nr:type I-A CRISPR-associated protein Cas7/Csa2 [Metallosphaera javensis (ex Hofmann et al. 2022)]MCG3109170.1 CRISPR-associated aCascade subunit Cas7/Csa2 2 [Metallosphaera javensis (ex Hofmann et al. 2022)]
MISGSVRFLVNVESLNGVESVGNLSRHRTAPIVTRKSNGEYVIRYVPVISGESLAHAYQMALVDIAGKMNLPVSNRTRQGELIKFGIDNVLNEEKITPPNDEKDARRFEVDVMLKDVVADVGGFMYAGKNPVRRSSRFMVGYMIPALKGDDIPAQLEAQFHVRYSVVGSKEEQAIYNVEVGSALYTVSFVLDDEFVGVPSNPGVAEREKELLGSRKARVEASVRALYHLLTGNFGAKRSRFLPQLELKSAVFSVTDFPFMVEPGHSDSYIRLSQERAEKARSVLKGNKVRVYAINREGLDAGKAEVKGSPEDVIEALISEVKG